MSVATSTSTSTSSSARQNCDMPEEMRQDCVDLVITAIERFAGTPQSYESAARLVKETMDKKYNESWVVVIGQGFAFEVTHEVKHVLWMFIADVSTLVYKGAALPRPRAPPRRAHGLRTTTRDPAPAPASPPNQATTPHRTPYRTALHGSWQAGPQPLTLTLTLTLAAGARQAGA